MAKRDMFGNPLSNPVPEQSGKTPGANSGQSPPVPNDVILNHMTNMVANVLHFRRDALTKLFDNKRDIDEECGFPHPEHHVVTSREYQLLYDREAIANAVVSTLPKHTWKVHPRIIEDENAGEEGTEFEKAVRELPRKMRGERSHLKSDVANPLWYACKKADILSRIGQFGVMFLGLDDGKEPDQEATPREGMVLHFVRCFQEELVKVTEVETDFTSPRFGQPKKYLIQFHDPRITESSIEWAGSPDVVGGATNLSTKEVHWSRVVHIADNRESSETYGVPAQKPVHNNLLSLKKLYGGSAEMYWKGAFPGLSVTSHPQLATELGNEVIFDKAAAREEIEQYMNGLQRYLALIGMDVKSLSPQVVDPSPQINVQLEAICAQTGIPKRKLLGLESTGAGDQEDDNWNEIIAARQNEYATPFIVAPLIDQLIYLKVLPTPEDGYEVKWPDLSSTTSQEKSRVAFQRTQAFAMYKRGLVEEVIAPLDFLTRVIGLDTMEAQVVIKNAKAHREEMLKEMEEKQKKMIDAGLMLDPTKVEQAPGAGGPAAKNKMSPKADVAGSSTSGSKPEVETMATRTERQSRPE